MSRNPGPWLLGVRNALNLCLGTGEVLGRSLGACWDGLFLSRRSSMDISRRAWLLRADLVLGLPSRGRCAGVRHGKLRPQGAVRSTLRAPRVAPGSCVQNPVRGSQNVGLQRMPSKWAGCCIDLENLLSGVGWLVFGPRLEDRTSWLQKPSLG